MKKPFDLDYLGEHGHISVSDAQRFHQVLIGQCGITDPDTVVADWDRRDPDAPWGSGKVGQYVHDLTEMVCAFMADKVAEAQAEKGEGSEGLSAA